MFNKDDRVTRLPKYGEELVGGERPADVKVPG